MSRRRVAVLALAAALLALWAHPAWAAPGDGCKTRECRTAVKEQVRAGWRQQVRPHRDWLRRLRACEATGRYRIVSPSGYRGAYQYDARTWQSVGGRGHVAGLWGEAWASPLEQDARTVRLRKKRGLAPWPVCGRGL